MDIKVFKKALAPRKFSFFKKNQSIVGIDIGTSSIKVAQLKEKEEQAILETYGELSVGPYAGVSVGQASHLVDEKVVEMIKDLIKEAGVKARRAAISVPLRSSFVTVIELPIDPDKDLSEVISYEARKYIPVPLSEIVFDWWILPKTTNEEDEAVSSVKTTSEASPKEKDAELKPKTEILLAAIHRDVLDKYKKVVSQIGLELALFEIEIFSTVRAVLGNEITPILVIDIGASTTKMTVLDYGIARFTYFLDQGSQDLSNALSHSLNINFQRAEEMKREIGLSSRPEHKEEFRVLEPLLDRTFIEAKRVIADYRRKRNRSIGHIILTGGGSLLSGLVDFAVNKVGIEVTVADPFSKVEYPSFLQPVLKKTGPTFSNVLGLTLRGLKS